MLQRLMPKSDQFFDDFEEQMTVVLEGVRLLQNMLNDFTDIRTKSKAIRDVEHKGDRITQRSFERLHKQFITPFDRAEIHQLLSGIDDILDLTDAAAERIQLYDIAANTEEAKAMADILEQQVLQLQIAVKGLRNVKKAQPIFAVCRTVSEMESNADKLLRAALAKLFSSGTDALTVIKLKEVLDLLEGATDKCQYVARVIEGVVLEHG